MRDAVVRPLRAASNNPLQRSVNDKVLGRGRGRALLDQVTSARVIGRTRPAAERGRYASFRLALALALLSVCLGATAAEVGTPPSNWSACYPRLQVVVRELAGPGAVDCGLFDRDSTPGDKEFTKRCAKRAWARNDAVVFGYRNPGFDSTFCDVAVRDAAGKIFSVFYDSDASGGSTGPSTLAIQECRTLRFKRGTIGRDSFFQLSGCEE